MPPAFLPSSSNFRNEWSSELLSPKKSKDPRVEFLRMGGRPTKEVRLGTSLSGGSATPLSSGIAANGALCGGLL